MSIKSYARESRAIDSLKKELSKATTDLKRSYASDVLAKEYMGINPDSGILYANRSLALAIKIKRYEYQVDALVTLGIIYRERGEFDTSLEKLHTALKICNAHKLHSHYYERVYTSLNLSYTEQGNYTVGIEYGFKALNEIEKNHDTLAMALANNNLANTYFNIKQYDKAMKHYHIALNYAIAIKEEYGQSLLTGNIGSVFYEQGQLDSAKIYFDRFLVLTKKVEDIGGEAMAYTNLGNYDQKKKNYRSSIDYFLKAEKIFTEMKMQPNLSDNYFNLATSYYHLNDLKKAEEYGLRSLQIADQIGSNPHREMAHQSLKDIYEKLHNTEKAYYHYKGYIAARDSTFNEKNKKEQFKAELVYEYDKKKYADSLSQAVYSTMKEQELNIEREKTKAQRTFTYISVGISCLLLLLAIYIFKNYKDKKKANKIISEQKEQVEIQKEEIELQKIVLETKNKAVTDSIYYASRIQKSLLPTEKYIERNMNKLRKEK